MKTSKKLFIKTTLGFVAVKLRRGLPENKKVGELDDYYFEWEYIKMARDLLVKEFDHILKYIGEQNKEEKEYGNKGRFDQKVIQ